MLTRQTDLYRLQSMFASALPVLPNGRITLYDEAVLQLTQTGIRDPLLALPGALWQRLPPLTTTTGNWTVTSDSRILGQANLRGISLEQPLFVVRNRAGHRTAAILGSGTWRWLNLAGDPAEEPRIWPQLVENLIQWLTTPEDDRTVRVGPIQSSFDGNEPIIFSGQVYDESLNPIPDAVVTVEVTAPDGATYPYTMENAGNGRFDLRIDALPEGTYSYTAQATRMNASLGTDTGTFTVGSMNLEHRSTRSNETLLRQIAYQSGGHFLTDATLNTLPDKLASDSLFTSTTQIQTLDFDLRRIPWILGLAILLLGTEWIIRKRNGLA
ncbi:MAG: carboxypeptidase-like regulatory domain-containing protein [Bacteroidetes bacterium]|nr:carboxypeptidase-like regulatory domain-containing protein [Bacteroidota bacterium]